ncbi:MAG TPA: spore cortex-lytic enzyme [Bacillales bacterium]|nr:spore cortex-lytic enzyme [Bacillales bacterium]
MGRRSRLVKGLTVGLLLVSLIGVSGPEPQRAAAFTDQVIQKGATGLNVVELQARLQYIGYYKGQIDGIFGWGTYWALRNFQQNYGLKVDGLAGLKTRQKLVSVTKYDEQWIRSQLRKGRRFTYYGGVKRSSHARNEKHGSGGGGGVVSRAQNVPQGFSQSDINLMVRMVYAESKGEPYIGKVAVAAVILNRIDSPKFPNTIPGVIYEPLAFSSVADGQLWVGQPKQESKKAVIDALNGWDPSNGALYYFNPAKATSDWIWSRPQIKKIGEHIFTK